MRTRRHHHGRGTGLQVKELTVRWGNRLVKLCLAGLALLLAGCVAFIAHAMLPAGRAWWITSGTAVAILLLMTVLPPRRPRRPD